MSRHRSCNAASFVGPGTFSVNRFMLVTRQRLSAEKVGNNPFPLAILQAIAGQGS
jgi:hypothetical protein